MDYIKNVASVLEMVEPVDGVIKISADVRDLLVKLLRGQERWISVEDRLPENSDTVLITHKGGVSFGWYNGRYWERGASTKHREIRTVSHWMPLPEPPEGVKQDD